MVKMKPKTGKAKGSKNRQALAGRFAAFLLFARNAPTNAPATNAKTKIGPILSCWSNFLADLAGSSRSSQQLSANQSQKPSRTRPHAAKRSPLRSANSPPRKLHSWKNTEYSLRRSRTTGAWGKRSSAFRNSLPAAIQSFSKNISREPRSAASSAFATNSNLRPPMSLLATSGTIDTVPVPGFGDSASRTSVGVAWSKNDATVRASIPRSYQFLRPNASKIPSAQCAAASWRMRSDATRKISRQQSLCPVT